LPTSFETASVPQSEPWSVGPGARPSHRTWGFPPSGVASRVSERAYARCSPGLATREHSVVVEQTPRPVDLLRAPRGPGATAASLGALSAREATDFQLDLPGDEGEVQARVAPSEVVHPAADSGLTTRRTTSVTGRCRYLRIVFPSDRRNSVRFFFRGRASTIFFFGGLSLSTKRKV